MLTLALMLPVAAGNAHASSHTWRIETLYSNADGTVQYVVLHESAGLGGQRFLAGKALTSTHAGVSKVLTFPVNLPSAATGSRRLLIATPGFSSLALIASDYTMPARFLATDGGTLDYAGVDAMSYTALPTDGARALDRSGSVVPGVATNFAGAAVVVPALPVASVEYYSAMLDHYFISDLAPDIDALDTGRIPGWSRTGQAFDVFPAAPGGSAANPVCRFYIPPAHGNSHFFSASPAECATVAQKTLTDPNFSGYVEETADAFYIALPGTVSGACPSGTTPVYRLWNARADSNHRYTADVSTKALMVSHGYVPEGYGADAVIMCAPHPGTARVVFTQGTPAPNGALVRDAGATATANYQGYATSTDSVGVGPRSGPGEVIAFSAHRPVAVQPVTWSIAASDQTVSVPFANEIQVAVTVWVVAGPFATTQQTALVLAQTAQQVFDDERFGVHMATLEVVDATANPKSAAWAAFTCGAGDVNMPALQSDIGARAARINVYLVGLVDGSTSRGQACAVGGGFVSIAAGAGADLMAHELGHAFGLEHIDDLVADFDVTNVMHSASNTRQFLTEGQIFRAHLRPGSAINAVYAARPALPVRNCDRDTPVVSCPAIRKRIFADGALGPN